MAETLQDRASRLFSEKPWKHAASQSLEEMEVSLYHCAKCGKTNYREDRLCSIPDPIDITDLGKVLKTFRIIWKGSCDEYMAGFIQTVMRPQNTWSMDDAECVAFFISMAFKEATAAQIWTMCCDAKEGE